MTTQVVFKVDAKDKAKAMKRAKRDGIPFAAVLKSVTRAYGEGRISMDIVHPEIPNAKTARDLRATAKAIKAGKLKGLSPEFTNAEDMITWLNQ